MIFCPHIGEGYATLKGVRRGVASGETLIRFNLKSLLTHSMLLINLLPNTKLGHEVINLVVVEHAVQGP